jgi:hypothetical protein
MVADVPLLLVQLLGALDVMAKILELIGVAAGALVDDRDHSLSGHVAAQDEHVGSVVSAGVDELAPAAPEPRTSVAKKRRAFTESPICDCSQDLRIIPH